MSRIERCPPNADMAAYRPSPQAYADSLVGVEVIGGYDRVM